MTPRTATVPAMRATRLALLMLCLLVVACAEQAGSGPAAQSSFDVLGGSEEAERLPDVELARLDGSGVLRTADLRGKPAVLNFWATWCAFCVDEMPYFAAVHADLGDEVRFVGIDREDHHERARKLAEKTGVRYELVADDDASFYRSVQARGMPATLFVDADGAIVHRHPGPLTEAELRDLIEEHLLV